MFDHQLHHKLPLSVPTILGWTAQSMFQGSLEGHSVIGTVPDCKRRADQPVTVRWVHKGIALTRIYLPRDVCVRIR